MSRRRRGVKISCVKTLRGLFALSFLAAPLNAQSLAQLQRAQENAGVLSAGSLENLSVAGKWADAGASRAPGIVSGEDFHGERILPLRHAANKRNLTPEPTPPPLAQDDKVAMGYARGFALGASWVMAPAAYLGSLGGLGKIAGAALGCLLFAPAAVAGIVTWLTGMEGTAPVLGEDAE